MGWSGMILSMWKRKRCRRYSTSVQRNRPRSQYEAAMGKGKLLKPRKVPYRTGGSQIMGTMYQEVFERGSRKLPKRGALSPPR